MSDDDESQRAKQKHNDFKQNYLKHDKNKIVGEKNATLDDERDESDNVDKKTTTKSHSKRHKNKRKYEPSTTTNAPDEVVRRRRSFQERIKRDTILDRGINHGGNAPNFKVKNSTVDSSTSSFENALLECYDGQILVAKYFPPSQKCNSVGYLDKGAPHLVSTHEVNTDGYYYYIFYSDNDDDSNHIHAIFDIHKPTYLYSNISEKKGCINSTECHFPIQMLSDEVVIVEVPTRDGIEHEDDDITLLVSECVPRMSVYVIFPILVLVFILGCAFI